MLNSSSSISSQTISLTAARTTSPLRRYGAIILEIAEAWIRAQGKSTAVVQKLIKIFQEDPSVASFSAALQKLEPQDRHLLQAQMGSQEYRALASLAAESSDKIFREDLVRFRESFYGDFVGEEARGSLYAIVDGALERHFDAGAGEPEGLSAQVGAFFRALPYHLQDSRMVMGFAAAGLTFRGTQALLRGWVGRSLPGTSALVVADGSAFLAEGVAFRAGETTGAVLQDKALPTGNFGDLYTTLGVLKLFNGAGRALRSVKRVGRTLHQHRGLGVALGATTEVGGFYTAEYINHGEASWGDAIYGAVHARLAGVFLHSMPGYNAVLARMTAESHRALQTLGRSAWQHMRQSLRWPGDFGPAQGLAYGAAGAWGAGPQGFDLGPRLTPAQEVAGNGLTYRVLGGKGLGTRIKKFTRERLSTDWRSWTPERRYRKPPEVDFSIGEKWYYQNEDPDHGFHILHRPNGTVYALVQINGHKLSPDQLKGHKLKIMCSAVPQEDFTRIRRIGDFEFEDDMSDIHASMSDLNPPNLRNYSKNPNYAIQNMKTNLPEGRVHFLEPKTFEEFEKEVESFKPDLLLVSGLIVNTRALLRMNYFARMQGAQEVWLGGDAATSPYKIINQAFNRVIWGEGAEYLHNTIVPGDTPFIYRHPPAEAMRAGVKWLIQGPPNIQHATFDVLHMALDPDCPQRCSYCAQGHKPMVPPTPLEQAIKVIEDAHAMGIKRVYFWDTNFGLRWKKDLHEPVLERLAELGMRWGCLTDIKVIKDHGPFMVDHGLGAVYLGLESFTGNLKLLRRGWQKKDKTFKALEWLREKGVRTHGLYMLFNKGESLYDVLEGGIILDEQLANSQVAINSPFWPTKDAVDANREGRVYDHDPDSVAYSVPTFMQVDRNGNVIILDPETKQYTYLHIKKKANDWRKQLEEQARIQEIRKAQQEGL